MTHILLYGKWKVGQSLARFCDSIWQSYQLCDESDAPESFDDFTYIIPSPGLSSSHRVYQSDKLLSELDFLSRFVPKGFLIHAVTGTDGKSTTSWILSHFLSKWFPDVPVYLGGNFGMPFAEILLEIQKKWEKDGHIVLEVSSFMAYSLQKFYATNSILTNLHPDHLDWHHDLGEYYRAKLNLLAHTKETLIYPQSVLSIFPELSDFPLKKIIIPPQLCLDHDLLVLSEESYLDLSGRQLFWDHNVRNIYAAALLAMKFGLTVKTLSSILPTIPALPHRLQQISKKDGKLWIDDSKSTTAQSLYAALQAFGKKVHLIAGGKNKWDPFTGLVQHLQENCAQCVTIGETKQIFLQACHDAFVPAISTPTLEEAVEYMSEHTDSGDIILLSPGCASFDMFQNYEDRAKHFAQAIHARK